MTGRQAREHVGDVVAYHPWPGQTEHGVITGTSDRYVFVRFAGDQRPKACDPQVLELETAEP